MVALDSKAIGYNTARETAAYRSGVSTVDGPNVGDATFLTNVAAKLLTGGETTLALSGRSSQAAKTIGVRVAYFYTRDVNGTLTRTLLGVSGELTLTSDGTLKDAAGSRWLAPDVFFDACGANEVRVFVSTAASAGTFDLFLRAY